MSPKLAPLRLASRRLAGLLGGEDRKWSADGQNVAIDPNRKWMPRLLEHLFGHGGGAEAALLGHP
jgi:hypothetical protein